MGSASRLKQVAAGDVIAGKFVVERTIGMGGMGQVVSARHRELGTRVAIKVVHASAAAEPSSVARFKREARAIAKLTSEHAVRVYDVGETESGLPFMIMEYLEGHDLGSVLLRNGPLSLHDAVDSMLQACDALVEAHDAGIVHRDLKPQNLFVSKRSSGENHVRVLDFGLAKPFRGFGGQGLTMPGNIIGTSQYMAPEQIQNLAVDGRTDIWGAGVCLFRLLTGQFPFIGETPALTCVRVLDDPPRPIATLRPDVPSELVALVGRCLEKSPAARFQDMRALAAALARVRGRLGATPPVAFAPPFADTALDATPPAMPSVPGAASVLDTVIVRETRRPSRRIVWGVLWVLVVALSAAAAIAVVVRARRAELRREAPPPPSAVVLASSAEPPASVVAPSESPAPTVSVLGSASARPRTPKGAQAGRVSPPPPPPRPSASNGYYDHL